jgi:hypothetical protein
MVYLIEQLQLSAYEQHQLPAASRVHAKLQLTILASLTMDVNATMSVYTIVLVRMRSAATQTGRQQTDYELYQANNMIYYVDKFRTTFAVECTTEHITNVLVCLELGNMLRVTFKLFFSSMQLSLRFLSPNYSVKIGEEDCRPC